MRAGWGRPTKCQGTARQGRRVRRRRAESGYNRPDYQSARDKQEAVRVQAVHVIVTHLFCLVSPNETTSQAFTSPLCPFSHACSQLIRKAYTPR